MAERVEQQSKPANVWQAQQAKRTQRQQCLPAAAGGSTAQSSWRRVGCHPRLSLWEVNGGSTRDVSRRRLKTKRSCTANANQPLQALRHAHATLAC